MTGLNESDNDGPSSWRASDKEVAQHTTANLCGDDVLGTRHVSQEFIVSAQKALLCDEV